MHMREKEGDAMRPESLRVLRLLLNALCDEKEITSLDRAAVLAAWQGKTTLSRSVGERYWISEKQVLRAINELIQGGYLSLTPTLKAADFYTYCVKGALDEKIWRQQHEESMPKPSPLQQKLALPDC